MSFNLDLNISFDFGTPSQPPPPPAAGTTVSPYDKAIADTLAYTKNVATKLSNDVGKPITFYIDWGFTVHPAFAAANPTQVFGKWLREMIEYCTTHGGTLSYLCRDAVVKQAVHDHIDGILFYLDPENRIKSPVGNAQGQWYHLHIQNRILVVSVNLNEVSKTSFYDYEAKFYNCFTPSPIVLSAIAEADKKIATEYSKKLSDVIGRPVPITVDWSFFKHPSFPRHPNDKKLIEYIKNETVQNSTTYGGTLSYLLTSNAYAKKLFSEQIDKIHYIIDMDNTVQSTVGSSQDTWYDLQLANRCLTVRINYNKYDARFNSYDTKFNALFNPSPANLLLVEKADKAVEEYSKNLERTLGRSYPVKVDWSFIGSPKFTAWRVDDQKKCLESLGSGMIKFLTVNGESLSYLAGKNPDIKASVLEKTDSILFQFDPENQVAATAGPDQTKWFDIFLSGDRNLVVRVNLDQWDKTTANGYEAKLKNALMSSPVQAAPVVVAAPAAPVGNPEIEQAIKSAETKVQTYLKKLQADSGKASLTLQVDWSFTNHTSFPGKAMIAKVGDQMLENSLTYGTTLSYLLRDAHVKNAFNANVDGILVQIDMANGVALSETNPGPQGTGWYSLSIQNRQLVVTVNFSDYDFNRTFPNFDTKFYALFNPSPLVLGLIEKADKKAEELNRKVDSAIGKSVPIKVDWMFLQHPLTKKAGDVTKMIPSIVDNFVTYTTTNGSSLCYLCEKKPEFKQAMHDKIDTIVYRLDPTDSTKSTVSADNWFDVTIVGRVLSVMMDLDKWDRYSFGSYENKLHHALFPPADKPVEPVSAPIVVQPVEIKVAASSTPTPAPAVAQASAPSVEPFLPTKPVVATPAPAVAPATAPAPVAAAAPAASAAPQPTPAGFPEGARPELIKAAEAVNKGIEEFRKKIATAMQKPEFQLTFDWNLLVHPTFVARSDCSSIISNLKDNIIQNSTVYSESINYLVDRFEAWRATCQKKVDKMIFVADPDNTIAEKDFSQASWYKFVLEEDTKTLKLVFNLNEYKSQRTPNYREKLEAALDVVPAIVAADAKKVISEWTPKLGGHLSIEFDTTFTDHSNFKSISRDRKLKFGTDFFSEMCRCTIHCNGLSSLIESPTAKNAVLSRAKKVIYRIDPTNSVNCNRGHDQSYWTASIDSDNSAIVFSFNIDKVDGRFNDVSAKLEPLFDLASILAAEKVDKLAEKVSQALNKELGSNIAVSVAYDSFMNNSKWIALQASKKSSSLDLIGKQLETLQSSLEKFNSGALAKLSKENFVNLVRKVVVKYDMDKDELEHEPEVGASGQKWFSRNFFNAGFDLAAQTACFTCSFNKIDEYLNVAAEKLAPYLQLASWEVTECRQFIEQAEQQILGSVGSTITFTIDTTMFTALEERYPAVKTDSDVLSARHNQRGATLNRNKEHFNAIVTCLSDIARFPVGKSTIAEKIRAVHIVPGKTSAVVSLSAETKTLTLQLPHSKTSSSGSSSWFLEIEALLGISVALWKLRTAQTLDDLHKEIPSAVDGKTITIEPNWSFVEGDFFKSLKSGVDIGAYLKAFDATLIGVARQGIAKTALNEIGKASIKERVHRIAVSVDSHQAKNGLCSIDDSTGLLSFSFQDPRNSTGFSELIQSALDLIIRIALHDTRQTQQQATESISKHVASPVSIEINVNSFNKLTRFLEMTPVVQSSIVRFLSSTLLTTINEAIAYLAKFPCAATALGSSLKKVVIGIAEGQPLGSGQRGCANSMAWIAGCHAASSDDQRVLNVTFSLNMLEKSHSSAGQAILDWALPIANVLNVDVQVGVLESSNAVAPVNSDFNSLVGGSHSIPFVIDWDSLTKHESVSSLAPAAKYTRLQCVAAALKAHIRGHKKMDSLEYILQFSAVKQIFQQNIKAVAIKFVDGGAHLEKTADGVQLFSPIAKLTDSSHIDGIRLLAENLFGLRPTIEQELIKEFDAPLEALKQQVAAAAGKTIPVEFDWNLVIDSKKDDYVAAMRNAGAVFKSSLGATGLVGLCKRNSTATATLARQVAKVKVVADPTNRTRPHIGQLVDGDFDATLNGSELVISGKLDQQHGNAAPHSNIEWVLAPEIASRDERDELDRRERERRRLEEERRIREEEERRRREEEERRRREEEERRRREEEKRREEDMKRYYKELAYYEERAAKVCVQCYGKAEKTCHGCDGSRIRSGKKCTYCEGKGTVRCGTCAGTGKLDPYLRPPSRPH